MLIDLGVIANDAEQDPGLRGIEITMNLTELLPNNVNLSTVDLRILPSL